MTYRVICGELLIIVDVWCHNNSQFVHFGCIWIKFHDIQSKGSVKIPEDQLVYGFLGQIRVHMASGSEILVIFGSSFMIYNTKGDPFRSSKIINSNNWDEARIYIESLVWPFSTVGTEDATKRGLKSSGCEITK
ncbi:hypothetical protein H5410_047960 [Solanum commersonii]|uniref:Uncharacterized protein n=1 Tax=Solanum commersonii TaxID=4109 RepID=A0A9J5XK83_SOLCO|nr:hypothetical protein H5410_047960 [Solanum commersonii]